MKVSTIYSSVSKSVFSLSGSLSPLLPHALVPPEIPKLSPPEDQYVAVNSSDNVTYICTANFPRSVLWVLGDDIIRRNEEFDEIAANFGVHIEPPNTNSQISTFTLTQMTWDVALENNADIIPVRCTLTSNPESIFDDAIATQIYQVFIVCK